MENVDLSGAVWVRSSFTAADAPEAVEVARVGSLVAIRNPAQPDQPPLVVSADRWQSYIDEVKLTAAVEWRRSAHHPNDVVEIAEIGEDIILMRRIDQPHRVLRFTRREWQVFEHSARLERDFRLDD
ncbi:MAG TPA: DUF397 domain-containing protein [Candidatus Saccharimonas sp.]|nr:DUF397 domain-containing protein [Candidatus Saccharimonas sp.]